MEVIGSLAKKYKISTTLSKKGRKYKYLNEEQTDQLKELMDRSDMTYTDPGKRDHGYIGKFEGKTGQNWFFCPEI